MADTATITAIDQSKVAQGYVTVNATVHIGTADYPQVYVSNNIDPASIVSDITGQAEVYRSQVLATPSITPTTTIASLVGDVIPL